MRNNTKEVGGFVAWYMSGIGTTSKSSKVALPHNLAMTTFVVHHEGQDNVMHSGVMSKGQAYDAFT